jgi:hypothetical protein
MSTTRSPRELLGAVLVRLPNLALAACVAFGCWYGYSVAHFGTEGVQGKRIFYDQYHVSRHKIGGKNKRGAWAYHEVSGYNEFYKALVKAGYDVTVHRKGKITPGMLDDYDIFFIGEQTHHANLMDDAERKVVFDWIQAGGGMWATVEHTNAHGMADHWNPWMEGTGVRARNDSICEPNGTLVSKDWVALETFTDHPIAEGIEVVYTCNGCSFDTEHGIGFSSADSWSDAWTPTDEPVFNGDNVRNPGELSGPLPGLFALDYGKGRIAGTCDHNLFANPTLFTGDHYQFLLNTMRWLGGEGAHTGLVPLSVVCLFGLGMLGLAVRRPGASLLRVGTWTVIGFGVGAAAVADEYAEFGRRDVLFTDTNSPAAKVRSKDKGDLFTFFEHVMKDPDTYAWLGRKIEPGYDALVLTAPTTALDDAQMSVVQGYLDDGLTVVYLATVASLDSDAGAQLLEQYGVAVSLERNRVRSKSWDVVGPSELTAGVEKYPVSSRSPRSVVTGDGVEVLVRLVKDDASSDFISTKSVGPGRFVVIAPADLLANRIIRSKEYRMGIVDLSMNLAAWMTDS